MGGLSVKRLLSVAVVFYCLSEVAVGQLKCSVNCTCKLAAVKK